MGENLAIPPMPEGREARMAWITEMASLGFKVKEACRLAGIPAISYYVFRRRAQESAKEGEDSAA